MSAPLNLNDTGMSDRFVLQLSRTSLSSREGPRNG